MTGPRRATWVAAAVALVAAFVAWRRPWWLRWWALVLWAVLLPSVAYGVVLGVLDALTGGAVL